MSDSAFFKLNPPGVLVYKNTLVLKTLVIFSALSFLTTLNLPYQGEEGVYTLTSLEMWFNHEWLNPTQYGMSYLRPPFLNWLIIPLASFLGWEQMLLASRLISATSTLITTALLFWSTNTLFRSKFLAWLAAALFLSGDLLLRRGWLAYADPLFSLWIFSAIVCSLMALEKRNAVFLIFSSLSICAAFLTKAMTAYLFYAITLFVLYWKHPNRRVLLSPASLVAHLFAFSFPFLWDNFLSHASHSQSMINDVLNKLSLIEILNYTIKLVVFPLDALFRFFPASAIVIYFFIIEKKWKHIDHIPNFSSKSQDHSLLFSILVWIVILNFLPYWLAPKAHVRYLLPLYPLVAIILAYLIHQWGEKAIKPTVYLLSCVLVFKYILGLWGYDFLEKKIRGNYLNTAEAILTKTGDLPLCAADDTAIGLSVIANLNILRLPKEPIRACQNTISNTNAISNLPISKEYLLVEKPEQFKDARIEEIYTLGRNKLYLMSREH